MYAPVWIRTNWYRVPIQDDFISGPILIALFLDSQLAYAQ